MPLDDSPTADPRPPTPDPRVPRRELFSAAASGLMSLATACGPAGARTEVVETPDGKILQWQHDELLVLVSGLRDSYRQGEDIRLKVLLNNQANRFGLYKVRTRLAGRGNQVVLEAPVASIQVKPLDAAELERILTLTPQTPPGEYTLVVELPPWSLQGLEGRPTGGGTLAAKLTLR